MQPKVSIIIPSADRAGTLGRAIDSALAQDYANVQVIVVDDGSEDETSALLTRYESTPNLAYIILNPPKSGSASTGRNLGLALTDADYISFLDSDDEIDPRKVRIQIETMQEDEQKMTPYPTDLKNLTTYHSHSEIDACFTQLYFIKPGQEDKILGNILDCFYPTHPNLIKPNSEQLSPASPITGLYRKELFNLLGGFKSKHLGEDSEFKERIISFGINLSFVYEPLYLYYRDSVNSLMNTIDRSDTEENRSKREKERAELALLRRERKFCSSEEEYIQKFRVAVDLESIEMSKIHNKQQLVLNEELPMTNATQALLIEALN